MKYLISCVLILSAFNVNAWQPTIGDKMHIQYSGTLNMTSPANVYNIDMEDTTAAKITQLKANGKHIICYFSAGSSENWRSDFSQFPTVVKGRNLDGWAGEKWLDVRRLDILMPIMAARMDRAVAKGCDAVDPDNVDGYANNTGFPLTYADTLAYNKALADAAHDRGLKISLKNNTEQVADLQSYFDFVVNEECFAYNECGVYNQTVANGKPVFNMEYVGQVTKFCPKARSMQFDSQKKKLSLNASTTRC